MELIWEAPTPTGRQKHDKSQEVAELKNRPNEWAIIGTDVPYNTYLHWKHGSGGFRPTVEFELAGRESYQPEGKARIIKKVYARYIKPEEAN